jgi:cobaltochelatase CobS
MGSLSAISACANAIHARYGNIRVGHLISSIARDHLEVLAAECGMNTLISAKARDTDLISIYLVAVKDAAGAKRVASKIALRLDDTLLGAPGSAPPTALPAVTVDLDAIRALIVREVKEGALDPLQASLERTIETFYGELAQVPGKAAEFAALSVRADLATLARDAAAEALKSMTPTRLDITRHGDPIPHALGLVHRDTAKIINALSAGVNVYLHGPAGSGKTTVARKVAEAFNLQFYFAAKVESEYQLMGFKDAKGETVRTQFREAYEHGGVFLFDEMDASSPSAVVALNAALANGICPFPDAIIERHADFICLGAGNTTLAGANRQYAGRNQLDAASIDRFAFIEFGYDDDLERALATDAAWCEYVQSVRAAVAERGLSHLVTPRATYDGCKLLAAGLDRDTVAKMCVFKGLDADTVSQIERAVRGTVPANSSRYGS